MPIKTKTLDQDIVIKAAAHEIYEAFLDARKLEVITELPAKINRNKGGKFSIFEGNISGVIVELEQDKKIVQKWRSEEDDWPPNFFTTVTLTFKPSNNGTTIIHLSQAGIPEESFENVKYNWKLFYFDGLKKYLEK